MMYSPQVDIFICNTPLAEPSKKTKNALLKILIQHSDSGEKYQFHS